MVRAVFSNNLQEQYESTMKFRKLLSIGERPSLALVEVPRDIFESTRRAQPADRGGDKDRRRTQVYRVPQASLCASAPG